MGLSCRWTWSEAGYTTCESCSRARRPTLTCAVSSFLHNSAYTIPVKFGDKQQFSLQVDTGSSDLVSSSLLSHCCSLLILFSPSGSPQHHVQPRAVAPPKVAYTTQADQDPPVKISAFLTFKDRQMGQLYGRAFLWEVIQSTTKQWVRSSALFSFSYSHVCQPLPIMYKTNPLAPNSAVSWGLPSLLIPSLPLPSPL